MFNIPYVSESCAVSVVCALTMILIDVATGIAAAILNHETRSEIMRHGLGHKTGEMSCVAIAVVFEIASNGAGLGVPAGTVVAGYIIAMEALSIMENVARINPDFKKTTLYQTLKGNLDKDNHEED